MAADNHGRLLNEVGGTAIVNSLWPF
jgi:hypothetical protein